jgi:predicted RNA binding protein YcfA (HicA-like mRNA interferase family)
MASGIPILKPQEVVAILIRLGFVEVRQRGSHKQFRHSDGRGTYQGRDISPVLLRQIAKDIQMSVDAFLQS